jgi:hypothetical protein
MELDVPMDTSHTSRAGGEKSSVFQLLAAAEAVILKDRDAEFESSPGFAVGGDGSADRTTKEQEIIYTKRITGFTQPTMVAGKRVASLKGVGYKTQYYDLIPVDVAYSRDKESFDALALKHLYTKAFLDRGMATLKPITATHDQQLPFDAVLQTAAPGALARKFTCNPPQSRSGCL